MKVLVTGGGGFLGSAICRQLQITGYEVCAFQRSAAPELESLGIEVLQGDIRDISHILPAMAGCDAVIHTAGKAGVWGNRADYFSINVGGTKTVLEACQAASVRYLVHTSSPSIVQGGYDVENGDESLPLGQDFSAAYPASKKEAEALVLSADCDTLRTTALRPHLIWGKGDPHLLPRLASKIRNGRIKLPGAEKLIDTIHVENAARAHLSALKELQTDARCAGKAYFITNGEPLAQGKIIAMMLEASGHGKVEVDSIHPRLAMFAAKLIESIWTLLRITQEPPLTRFAAEQLSTAHWYDCSAAQRDFGWTPHISIEEGLKSLRK